MPLPLPPSSYAIEDLVNGKKGALASTAGLTLARTLIIAPGIYIAGVRDKKTLAMASLSASLSVTIGMIGLKLYQKWVK